MLDRVASLSIVSSLAIVSSVAIGCSAEIAPSTSELDELAHNSWVTTVSPDAGPEPVTAAIPLRRAFVPTATTRHDCHDPCPGPCGADEACCAPTQRCVRVDCPSCCPDPAFGFDAIRAAFTDR